MRPTPSLALICEGPVSRTIARLPGLSEELGWVKSTSFATAKRAAKVLRAGLPVAEMRELGAARVFALTAPDGSLPDLVEELRSSGLEWRRKVVIALGTTRDIGVLKPIETEGASTATMCMLGRPEQSHYVIEGRPAAVKSLHRLLGRSAPTIEISLGTKQTFLSSAHRIDRDFVILLANVIDRFRRCGLRKTDAEKMARDLLDTATRNYFRSGQRLLRPSANRLRRSDGGERSIS